VTQRIRYTKRGDILTAVYVNKIVDGANRALDVLGPPRSTKSPETGTGEVPLDADGDPTAGNDPSTGGLSFLGSEVLEEESRITSVVRVTDPNDSSVWVDVERIDEITFGSTQRRLTLKFDNE